MLASLRLSGITVALTDWHDVFLCLVSCLTHVAALFLKNVIPSHTVYNSKATNCSHTVVIDCSVLADISFY